MGSLQAPQDRQDAVAPFTPADPACRLSDTQDTENRLTSGSLADEPQLDVELGLDLSLELDPKQDQDIIANIDISNAPPPLLKRGEEEGVDHIAALPKAAELGLSHLSLSQPPSQPPPALAQAQGHAQGQCHTQLPPENALAGLPLIPELLYPPLPSCSSGNDCWVSQSNDHCIVKSAPTTRPSTPNQLSICNRPAAVAAAPPGCGGGQVKSGSGTWLRSSPGVSASSGGASTGVSCTQPRSGPPPQPYPRPRIQTQRSNCFQLTNSSRRHCGDSLSSPSRRHPCNHDTQQQQQPHRRQPDHRRPLLRSRPTVQVPLSRISCRSGTSCEGPATAPVLRNPSSWTSYFAVPPRAAASKRRSKRTVDAAGVAMPGHSTGGGAPNSKRSAADDAEDCDTSTPVSGSKSKLPRVDRGAEDFSSVVKSRLSSYTRTGQACDRCKVRKIRCDALPEGCSHCINLGLECFVTDRITGRTERRGYIQELERDKTSLKTRIRDLENLLRDKGVEVKPLAPRSPVVDRDDDRRDSEWRKYGSLLIKTHASKKEGASAGRAHSVPFFSHTKLESRPEDSGLNVGWDSKPLSSIRGTKLSIMGMTIDTAELEAPDSDEPPAESTVAEPLYNKSLHALLRSVFGVNPPMQLDLPTKEEAFQYTEWYFLIMSRYLPVLHKPSYMALLDRIYTLEGFVPTTPELIQVHMVFAIMFYQFEAREPERRDHLHDLSNKHYHFSLSKVSELMISTDKSAIQAMVLIAAHTRAFPKPGCGTFICNMTFQRAVDLNLNLAPKVPSAGTNLDTEMRKRIWWVLLVQYVAVTGRRGRPMPLAVHDFDVPLPEAVNDELLSEEGIREPQSEEEKRPLDWEVGMLAFKILPIMMQMYSGMYGVRRDAKNYPTIIKTLEHELQRWEDDVPLRLQLSYQKDRNEPLEMVSALYIRMFVLETRLWLRHNSVNPTNDKVLMADNSRICEKTSRELLGVFKYMMDFKALDSTWSGMTVYVLSMFSTLVAHWERRFQSKPEELVTLREEMDTWMAIIKEASQLIGSGPGIQNKIARFAEQTMVWIEQDMRQKQPDKAASTTSASSASVRLKREEPAAPDTPPTQVTPEVSRLDEPQELTSARIDTQTLPQSRAHQVQAHTQTVAAPAHNPSGDGYYRASNLEGHPPFTGLDYGGNQAQGPTMAAQAYGGDAATMFYPSHNQAQTVAASTTVVTSAGETPTNSVVPFPSQATQDVDPSNQFFWQRAGGGNTWQDWTAAMAQTADRYGAGALMSMGTAPTGMNTYNSSVTTLGDASAPSHTMQWPGIVLYDQDTPHTHTHPHQHHHHNQHPHPHQPHPQPQHTPLGHGQALHGTHQHHHTTGI